MSEARRYTCASLWEMLRVCLLALLSSTILLLAVVLVGDRPSEAAASEFALVGYSSHSAVALERNLTGMIG